MEDKPIFFYTLREDDLDENNKRDRQDFKFFSANFNHVSSGNIGLKLQRKKVVQKFGKNTKKMI